VSAAAALERMRADGVGCASSPWAAVGAGTVTELGRYFDEIDDQITTMDGWVRGMEQDGEGGEQLGQGFFGTWATFMEADPWYLNPTNNRPSGWRAFLRDYESLLTKLTTDDPVWAMLEAFEDELVRLWDWANGAGSKPPIPRPKRGFQPPPPSDTWEGKLEGAIQVAAGIGLLFGVGYVIRGIRP
jgi:hypothetical protein